MTKTVIIIMMFLISIGVFVKYINPEYDKINTIKAKISRVDEALDKTRNIRRMRGALSKQAQDFSDASLDRLDKLLPPHVDNVGLVLELDGIASQYGIRIKNVEVKQKEDLEKGTDTIIGSGGLSERGYQSLIIQFDISATYPEFLLFIKDVEQSLRIVDMAALKMVEDKSVQKDEKNIEQEEPVYKFTMALRTYWLNNK